MANLDEIQIKISQDSSGASKAIDSLIDSLEKLCINGTKVILLELGGIPFSGDVIDEILDLSYYGYTVVLAHIERYAKQQGFSDIKKIIASKEAYAQCNAASFISGPLNRTVNHLLKEDLISAVASDMHSVDLRPPLIKEAFEKIEKKFGASSKNKLINQTEKLYELMVH